MEATRHAPVPLVSVLGQPAQPAVVRGRGIHRAQARGAGGCSSANPCNNNNNPSASLDSGHTLGGAGEGASSRRRSARGAAAAGVKLEVEEGGVPSSPGVVVVKGDDVQGSPTGVVVVKEEGGEPGSATRCHTSAVDMEVDTAAAAASSCPPRTPCQAGQCGEGSGRCCRAKAEGCDDGGMDVDERGGAEGEACEGMSSRVAEAAVAAAAAASEVAAVAAGVAAVAAGSAAHAATLLPFVGTPVRPSWLKEEEGGGAGGHSGPAAAAAGTKRGCSSSSHAGAAEGAEGDGAATVQEPGCACSSHVWQWGATGAAGGRGMGSSGPRAEEHEFHLDIETARAQAECYLQAGCEAAVGFPFADDLVGKYLRCVLWYHDMY